MITGHIHIIQGNERLLSNTKATHSQYTIQYALLFSKKTLLNGIKKLYQSKTIVHLNGSVMIERKHTSSSGPGKPLRLKF